MMLRLLVLALLAGHAFAAGEPTASVTASVTGVWFMICPTAAISKSSPTRRTLESSSCTPTSITKVRGGTRWPVRINSPIRI